MEMPSFAVPEALVAAVIEVDWKAEGTASKTYAAEEAQFEADPAPRKGEKFSEKRSYSIIFWTTKLIFF